MRRGGAVPPDAWIRRWVRETRRPTDWKRWRADLRLARRESLRAAEELRRRT